MFPVSSSPQPQPQLGEQFVGSNNLSNTLSQMPSHAPETSDKPMLVNYGGGTNLESPLATGEAQQQLKSSVVAALLQLFGPLIQVLTNSQTGQNGSKESMLANSTSEQLSAVDGSVATPTGGSGDLHLPKELKPYLQDIQNAADKTGVPAEILAAQIWQESRGNLGAATVNGGNGLQDNGLMQVNSNTFADLQSKNPSLLGATADPNNARDNIMAGALYMKEQINTFDGNIGAALRAYNSGPNNVNLNDLCDISKTGTGDTTYVDKVMSFAQIIRTGQGQLPA